MPNANKPTAVTSPFLTRQQAAQYLMMTPGSLSNLHGQGKGPAYYKRGKLVYYRIEDLDAWITSGRVDAEAK